MINSFKIFLYLSLNGTFHLLTMIHYGTQLRLGSWCPSGPHTRTHFWSRPGPRWPASGPRSHPWGSAGTGPAQLLSCYPCGGAPVGRSHDWWTARESASWGSLGPSGSRETPGRLWTCRFCPRSRSPAVPSCWVGRTDPGELGTIKLWLLSLLPMEDMRASTVSPPPHHVLGEEPYYTQPHEAECDHDHRAYLHHLQEQPGSSVCSPHERVEDRTSPRLSLQSFIVIFIVQNNVVFRHSAVAGVWRGAEVRVVPVEKSEPGSLPSPSQQQQKTSISHRADQTGAIWTAHIYCHF